MKLIIFAACLVLFACSSWAWVKSPYTCCFTFTSVRIPVKQVESYHTTHLQCHNKGIILITKHQSEICVNPTERWVQRLIKLVDAQRYRITTESNYTRGSLRIQRENDTTDAQKEGTTEESVYKNPSTGSTRIRMEDKTINSKNEGFEQFCIPPEEK